VLLQMYEPLLLNRVKRAQGQQKHIDSRELLTAARQGLLRAAARFDPQRVTAGRDRLYALAERYISMALRDVLSEVREGEPEGLPWAMHAHVHAHAHAVMAS
jgi:DNA-directed RNA polymerase specialized sigma subunit